jgi:hypothetical protein
MEAKAEWLAPSLDSHMLGARAARRDMNWSQPGNANSRSEVASRTGRFPQLVDPRSGVNPEGFATISLPRMRPETLRAINSEAVRPKFVGVLRDFAPPSSWMNAGRRRNLTPAWTSLLGCGLTAPRFVLVYFLYLMDFEYDSTKSLANLTKHGIDFSGAQALWSDPDRIEIPSLRFDQ